MKRTDIKTERGEFATLQAGEVGRPVVLCAHGFPDHPRTFAPLASGLVRAGYRVVAPWLRGYAPSTLAGPFDALTIARDLIALSEHLSPSDPVVLIGHDWGAVAAYDAVEQAPDRFRAAVTMSVPHRLTFFRNMNLAQLRCSAYMAFLSLPLLAAWRVRENDFAYVSSLWRDWTHDYVPEVGHIADVKACLRESVPAPLGYYRALFQDTPRLLRDLLDVNRVRISVPTLHIHGASDRCVLARTAGGQERLFEGRYELAVLDDVGHFPHVEATVDVSSRVLTWIESSSKVRHSAGAHANGV